MAPSALSNILFDRAAAAAHRDYVVHNARSYSYGDFAALVSALATTLEARGWGGATRVVGVSTDDPLQLLSIVWACAASGTDLAFCPVIEDAAQLERTLAQVGANVLLTGNANLLAHAWAADLGRLVDAASASASGVRVSGSTDAAASFLFQTSGTSGEPKWVRCPFWKCHDVVESMWNEGVLRHTIDQTVFLTPPLFHSYGLSSCFEYTRGGATLVLPGGDSPLGPVGELRQQHLAARVTALEGVPNFHLQLSQLIGRLSLPRLQHIGFGGGALDQVAVERLRQRHPTLTYSVRYGLTETPSVVTHKVFRPPYEDDWRVSGRIVPIYRLEIVGPTGAVLGPNEEGEIRVGGDCVCSYLGGVDTTTLNTGDVGYLTAAGELRVVGRGSAFLKYRGYRLSPEQIESVVRQYSAVTDCRALVRDERLIVEVVAADGFSRAELLTQLKAKLPLHAIPEEIALVDAIPRTASGKIKRH